MKWVQTFFVAVIVLAVIWRVSVALNSPLITVESFTWRVIDYSWSDMVCRVAEDGHAPLYFIVLKAYSILAGKSLESLRLFSVFCYSLAMAAHYCSFRAAQSLQEDATRRELSGHDSELLLLLLMLTFDPLQFVVATNARMYPLGMLFLSLSSWAFLSALAPGGRYSTFLWIGWGILTGAGMLTHHFVSFAAAGQAIAGVWVIFLQNVSKPRKIGPALGSLIVGCLSAIVVYSPWLSVIEGQVSEVNRDFWIGPLTLHGVAGLFSSWLGGSAAEDWATSYVLLSNFLAIFCIAIGLRKCALATVPFACQALIPWVLCITVSVASGRSLLQDRYFVFGQASALTAICLGWGSFKSVSWRVVAGAVLLASHLVGSIGVTAIYRPPLDSFALCVDAVLAHDDGKTSKTILVGRPADVNRTRYFLDRAKRNDFRVKLLFGPFRTGHIGHIAAVDSSEIYWSSEEYSSDLAHGVWYIYDQQGDSPVAAPGTNVIAKQYDVRTTDSMNSKVVLFRSLPERTVPDN